MKIDTKGQECIHCKESLENCLDEDLVIIGSMKYLAHKKCTSPFDEELYT